MRAAAPVTLAQVQRRGPAERRAAVAIAGARRKTQGHRPMTTLLRRWLGWQGHP